MMPTRIYAQENMSLSALKFSRGSFHSLNICHKNCFFWAAPAPPTTSNLFYYWTIITSVPSHVANHSPTSCSHVAYSTHTHPHSSKVYIYTENQQHSVTRTTISADYSNQNGFSWMFNWALLWFESFHPISNASVYLSPVQASAFEWKLNKISCI